MQPKGKEPIVHVLVILCLSVLSANGTKQQERRAEATPQSVCYSQLGCFDSRPPFNNTKYLPDSPGNIDTKFRLFTREKLPGYDALNYKDRLSVSGSNFKPSRKTKILIHGFTDSINTIWLRDAKDALLHKYDFNVLVVGWGNGAAFPNYDNAVSNLRVVAKEVKLLLDIMVGLGLDLNDVHIIGHSLGAHMAGSIGQDLSGKIGRITGLDPAEPSFEYLSTAVRLDPSDAKFVDVVHTDIKHYNLLVGGYGLEQPSGHVDIYVNGGQTQPGCKETTSGIFDIFTHPEDLSQGFGRKVACSHHRSVEIFVESVKGGCSFKSYPCKDFAQFEKGECLTCGQGCSSVGYLADQMPGRGIQYFNTLSQEPFCGEVYSMVISPASRQRAGNHGTLYMALVGETGKSSFTQVTPLKAELPRSPINHIVVFENVGKPKSVETKYVKSDQFLSHGSKEFSIGDVQLKDPSTGVVYRSCEGPYKLEDDHVEEIKFSEDCIPIG